jgi:hypothetical protein
MSTRCEPQSPIALASTEVLVVPRDRLDRDRFHGSRAGDAATRGERHCTIGADSKNVHG